METTAITTPSGHKVTLKTSLTFGENRQIQRAAMSEIRVNQKTQESIVDGSRVYEAQDLALKLIVQKIETTDGAVVEGDKILDTIMGWSQEDGMYLYDKIDELTSPSLPPKKGA